MSSKEGKKREKKKIKENNVANCRIYRVGKRRSFQTDGLSTSPRRKVLCSVKLLE